MTIIKSLVVCLALANAGYFVWMQGIGRSQAVPAGDPANTLKLASEVPEPERPAEPDAAPDSSAGSAVAANDAAAQGLLTSVARCVTVGPFKDVSEASRTAGALRGGGYNPRQRVVEAEVWAGVWVYLPVPPNRAASDQVMAKLKAAGIEEALEMPGPADSSVISLGLFSEQKRAQARVAQTQALGLNPALVDRKRTGNVYWIDIDLKPADAMFNPADLQADKGHISRLEVKACPAAP